MIKYWLKARRKQLGLTQEQLTTRLNLEGLVITRGTLSHWETGRYEIPFEDKHVRTILARVLNLDVSEMLQLAGYEVKREFEDVPQTIAQITSRLTREQQKLVLDYVRMLEQRATNGV